MAKHFFYLGKGGVGKSTISALDSLKSAEQGYDTLLVSMDPAHNQSDIFQIALTENPKQVIKNLHVIEINLEKQIKNYLHDIESRLKQSYRYLTAFNLENQFNIIQYSPGIEEYALLQVYDEIAQVNSKKDMIIFDMPPTALTLKFFNLPKLSMLWLEKLLLLRKQIIEKKEIITKIKFGKKIVETDKITKNLLDQLYTYQKINENFQNKTIAQIVLIMNPDMLSINESIKIKEKLRSLKMSPNRIIVNKYRDENRTIFKPFDDVEIQYFPLQTDQLMGLENLKKYFSQFI